MDISNVWLSAIKKDIEQKYGVKNPEFLVDGALLPGAEFEVWLKKYIPSLWMKYKRLTDNQFELKPFSPDPDDRISMSLIDSFLKSLPKTGWYTVNYIGAGDPAVIESDSWYTEEEVRGELRYLFRIGKSKISLYKESSLEGDNMVHHLFIEEDSLENMLKSGYLQLEFS